MKQKIYIAGKISDLPKDVYEKNFEEAMDICETLGYEPINPCELEHCENATWSEFMLTDIKALFECDAIYMLNNWADSKGARIEHAIAVNTGKKIIYQR